jgi:glutamate/tyrosine decarboxylase-like PLP-dependent enzyme
MWLPLQLFGVAPFRAALEEKVLLCRYFHEKIQELGFVTGPEPPLSITIFRYVPDTGDTNAFNEALIWQTRKDGRFFFSTTTIGGDTWIRLAVLSFRTHLEEVDGALSLLEAGVRKLMAECR